MCDKVKEDDDFQDMLNNLDIVVESMEEGHTIITPRVDHKGRGKTCLLYTSPSPRDP